MSRTPTHAKISSPNRKAFTDVEGIAETHFKEDEEEEKNAAPESYASINSSQRNMHALLIPNQSEEPEYDNSLATNGKKSLAKISQIRDSGESIQIISKHETLNDLELQKETLF